MEDEAKWLQHRLDNYWRLLAGVMDERAVQAIQQMIAELEGRLKQIGRLDPSHNPLEGFAATAAGNSAPPGIPLATPSGLRD